MILYECLKVIKLLSVMGLAGGVVAAFVATDKKVRKHAAHRIASPCLLVVWLSGYALLTVRGWPFFQLWVVGALALSVAADAALAFCVARGRRSSVAFLSVAAPLACAVALMVAKPMWGT